VTTQMHLPKLFELQKNTQTLKYYRYFVAHHGLSNQILITKQVQRFRGENETFVKKCIITKRSSVHKKHFILTINIIHKV